jgi:ABC-type molybdate transport system substrate-binding protein
MNWAKSAALFSIIAILLLSALLFFMKQPGPDRSANGTGKGLVLYCAAGIKPPVEAAARAYEAEYGIPIQIQYGGSGTLLSNLQVARRGDLYLAGDDDYLSRAREKELVREILPLATMKPVIAVQKGNPKSIAGVSDLLRDEVATAIANPGAAAIGRITRELLSGSGQWAVLEENAVVTKPTVTEIANDLKLGTIDAAVLWDATVAQYDELEAIAVPGWDQATQQIAIGILNWSERPTAALHFARYLAARDRGLLEFERSGYQPVMGDVWADVPEATLFSGGVNRLAVEPTITAFEEREGCRITRVYNGCGILVAQMKAGQWPDAYFSCDVSFMTQVADLFLDSIDLTETDMVLVVARDNPLKIESARDLTREGIRVGIANAEQSALGALTKALLEKNGLYDDILPNVRSQTPTADLLVNQLRTGSLDAVIVYKANTSQIGDKAEVLSLGLQDAVARQPYAVGAKSEHPYLMQRLLEAIRKDASRFEETGFRWIAGAELGK